VKQLLLSPNQTSKSADFVDKFRLFKVTCETIAVVAGTLAHGGVCPITGEKVTWKFLKQTCFFYMRPGFCLNIVCIKFDQSWYAQSNIISEIH
jgi:hypothetical protein